MVGQPGAATGVRARLAAVPFRQWLGMAIFATVIAGSAVAWYGLARQAKFPPILAAAPTVALDLGALFFGLNWIFGQTRRLQAWGKITTILAVLVSVVGNAAAHAVDGKPVSLWLVAAVGAIPPAAAFAVAHQIALDMHADDTERVNGSAEVPGKRHGESVYTQQDKPYREREPEVATRAEAPEPPEPESDAASASAAAAVPRPDGTVVELTRPPTPGTKVARARELYRGQAAEILGRGGSLDEIVLADIDRAIDSDGYAKKHARRWRAEVEGEHGLRGEG